MKTTQCTLVSLPDVTLFHQKALAIDRHKSDTHTDRRTDHATVTSDALAAGPDLAGGRPGASWWEASAQLLHN